MASFLNDYVVNGMNAVKENVIIWTEQYMEVYILGSKQTGKTSLVRNLNGVKLGKSTGNVIKFYDFSTPSWLDSKTLIFNPMEIKSIIKNSDGIVYVFDASDTEQFDEYKRALTHIFKMIKDLNVKRPILIFGNKVDKYKTTKQEMIFSLGLMSKQKQIYLFYGFLRLYAKVLPAAIWDLCLTYFHIESIPNIEGLLFELFVCSFEEKFGYLEGIQWLGQQCKNERSIMSNHPMNNKINKASCLTAIVTV